MTDKEHTDGMLEAAFHFNIPSVWVEPPTQVVNVCAMCEWIKKANLHPHYAELRTAGAGHMCKDKTRKANEMLKLPELVELSRPDAERAAWGHTEAQLKKAVQDALDAAADIVLNNIGITTVSVADKIRQLKNGL